MKLSLKLEWLPAESAWVEVDLTDEDLKSDQVEVFEKIKLAWAGVRSKYVRAS